MLKQYSLIIFVIAGLTLLSGCNLTESNNPDNSYKPADVRAVVATVASDYSSSALSFITGDTNRQAYNELLSDPDSDRTVQSFNNNIYVISRYSGANIAKFTLDNLETPVWQYSTQDTTTDPTSSNPQQIIFISETKAYVLRYGRNTVWIVNPSAATEAEFKTGEIDLSAYADSDGLAEIKMAALAGDKLFIAMQRLDRDNFYAPTNTAYVAIIDTTTDTEVDAGISGDSLNGIPLIIRNPDTSIQYLAANNSIYIQGIGSYTQGEDIGGIERIDLTDYSTSLIIDDGTAASHPNEKVSAMAIMSPTLGYYVSYISWGMTALYQFNPSTGEENLTTVAALSAGDFSDITIDANSHLWVSDVANATVHVIDPLTDSSLDSIYTGLNPQQVAFVNQ